MAIERRQIQGTILDPNGVGVAGGTIDFKLDIGSGTTQDDATSAAYVVGGSQHVVIGADGSVDFFLVPNDKIDPSGSNWVATFKLPGLDVFREKWNLPDGAVIQIGDIVRV